MVKKLKVLILFGGKSAEHEVSLQSAKNLVEAIDKNKYDVLLVGIDKNGQWHLYEYNNFLENEADPKSISLKQSDSTVVLLPWKAKEQLVNLSTGRAISKVDVVFPILHGPFGEDGTVQGFLKLADLPFVGADVLGSAVGMDKDVAKRLLRDAGLPIAQFLTFFQNERPVIHFEEITAKLGLPLFVKPTNLGSSVGINKVTDRAEFTNALDEAFKYDIKILIEEFIRGREIECSVLGNEDPIASVPGEIVAQHDFYSYDAKYIDESGAILESPAKLPQHLIEKVQQSAIQVYRILCCEGMARVDFFLKENEELVVNEINTIPGFTKISMYPKLFELTGIPYTVLIDRLIQLAVARHSRRH